MYLVDGTCSLEKFQADVCPFDDACECGFLDRSESIGPKPRRLSAPNFGPGDFALIVWNTADTETNVSWQLRLTTTSAATVETSPRSHTSESGVENFATAAKRPPS